MATTLRDHIKMRFDAFGSPIDEFMLREGRVCPIGPRTFAGPRMTPKECFANATTLAQRDPALTYVEGHVWTVIPIQHAWVIDRDGTVIDPTLVNHDGRVREYFGVAFSTRYLLSCTLKNRCYGLLDAYHNRRTIHALLDWGKVDFRPKELAR